MKKIVKIFKKSLDVIMFVFGARGTKTAKKYIDMGIIDFSGQGRDKYGN